MKTPITCAWADALRSGKYQQGDIGTTAVMRSNDKYNAYGVLLRVLGVERASWTAHQPTGSDMQKAFGWNCTSLAIDFDERLRTRQDDTMVGLGFVHLNRWFTFEQMADLIDYFGVRRRWQ